MQELKTKLPNVESTEKVKWEKEKSVLELDLAEAENALSKSYDDNAELIKEINALKSELEMKTDKLKTLGNRIQKEQDEKLISAEQSQQTETDRACHLEYQLTAALKENQDLHKQLLDERQR